MKNVVIPVAFAALSACVPAPRAGFEASDPTGGQPFCAGSDSPICRFLNAPVALEDREVRLPGRPYVFKPIREEMAFVDATGTRWRAPVGTLTDGASVPLIFAPIVGSPTSREFVNAAAMHDAMCGIGNTELPGFHTRTWEATHRMFYEALRVGGTDEFRAKLMFAAVYLGGPRWLPGDKTFDIRQLASSDPRISTQGQGGAVRTRGYRDQALGHVSTAEMKAIMLRTRDFIRDTDPDIGALESYVHWEERRALRRMSEEQERGEADVAPPTFGIPEN